MSLGLLQADFRDRTVRLVNPDGNQEVAIVAAISAQRSFQIGISLLEANMNVSAKEIGGAISKALGRDWSEGSRKRYGHAIRSWILRFYPNLRPPIPGERAYLYSHVVTKVAPRKGPYPLVSEEILRKVAGEIPFPTNSVRVAEFLGVSTETIRRWRRKNRERWSELFES